MGRVIVGRVIVGRVNGNLSDVLCKNSAVRAQKTQFRH